MKLALIVIAALTLAVLLLHLYGTRLPREHVAQGDRAIALPPDQVAALIRAVEQQPDWRPSVKRIEVLEPAPALRYRETGKNGQITYRFTEIEPGRTFESRIDDDKLPFGGRWLITIEPDASGSRVRIREEGFVNPPIFRVLSLHVFGHDTTLKGYLDDLEAAANRKT